VLVSLMTKPPSRETIEKYFPAGGIYSSTPTPPDPQPTTDPQPVA